MYLEQEFSLFQKPLSEKINFLIYKGESLFGLENIIFFRVCRIMSPLREPSIHTELCNGKSIWLEQSAL